MSEILSSMHGFKCVFRASFKYVFVQIVIQSKGALIHFNGDFSNFIIKTISTHSCIKL